MGYRFLPHTADVRVAVDADSFGMLLTHAVRALRTLLAGRSPVAARRHQPLHVEGADAADTLLLVLREVLLVFEARQFVPAELEILAADHTAVRAVLHGEPFDPQRHEPQPEVKAVTRHGLVVRERAGRWHAEIVFDV